MCIFVQLGSSLFSSVSRSLCQACEGGRCHTKDRRTFHPGAPHFALLQDDMRERNDTPCCAVVAGEAL